MANEEEPLTENPILDELLQIMLSRFEHLEERGFVAPYFVEKMKNDPQEILKFIRQNRAVVSDQLDRRLHPSIRPTIEHLQSMGIIMKSDETQNIEFNLQQLKSVGKNKKYVVFGYIRNIQKLFTNSNINNHYLNLPQLIGWHILYYYHNIQLEFEKIQAKLDKFFKSHRPSTADLERLGIVPYGYFVTESPEFVPNFLPATPTSDNSSDGYNLFANSPNIMQLNQSSDIAQVMFLNSFSINCIMNYL